jgi:hypothetical protein
MDTFCVKITGANGATYSMYDAKIALGRKVLLTKCCDDITKLSSFRHDFRRRSEKRRQGWPGKNFILITAR